MTQINPLVKIVNTIHIYHPTKIRATPVSVNVLRMYKHLKEIHLVLRRTNYYFLASEFKYYSESMKPAA